MNTAPHHDHRDLADRTATPRPCASGPASTDGQLVVACRAGDQSAWNELVRRHARRLWAIARREGLDSATAEDAVQMTWSTLITSLDNIHNDEAVSGYLATMVRRQAIRLAKGQRRNRHTNEHETDASAIEESVLASERAQELRRAFALLRPSDQQLLGLLFSDEEHSYVDIATMVGCPIGSIGPTRRRALERLADLLDDATV